MEKDIGATYSTIHCGHGDDDSAVRCALAWSSGDGSRQSVKIAPRNPPPHTGARSLALHTCEKNGIQTLAVEDKLTAGELLRNWQTNVPNVPHRNSAV